MTIQEMKRRKQEWGYTDFQIAELSGVPLETVQKIFAGETKNIEYRIWNAVENAFREKMVVMETAAAYEVRHKPGSYTIEDYRELPDDQRVELIDGYFYDMAAPTTFHQMMAGEVYRQVANHIIDRNGDCTTFISPVDVQLDSDEKTMIQPDVVIVCDPQKIVRRNIIGAPDFVLEVVSPGTKRRDYIVKLAKYEHAKVREYWIVDPYTKKVLVYFLEGEGEITIYPIDARIPVRIFGGELVLDFGRIAQWAERDWAERE